MTITHILFDLVGTLVAPDRLQRCHEAGLGSVMAARFGGSQGEWRTAYRAILHDWDSYFADLDFSGDRGVEDRAEGAYRTTRALFRHSGRTEPDHETLKQLARELPFEAIQHCDALYPDCRGALGQLHDAGYMLGVASHAPIEQIRGALTGGGVMRLFSGPFVTPESAGHFEKDAAFYLSSGLAPDACLVVDDEPDALASARSAGMQTLYLRRARPDGEGDDPTMVRGDLRALLRWLNHNA